jgi:hypothetical protein
MASASANEIVCQKSIMKCICNFVPTRCTAETHKCPCKHAPDRCHAVEHPCICATNGHLVCKSLEHQCICTENKKHAELKCRATTHQCICKRHALDINIEVPVPTRTLKCRSTAHECVCKSIRKNYIKYKKPIVCRKHCACVTHMYKFKTTQYCVASSHNCLSITIFGKHNSSCRCKDCKVHIKFMIIIINSRRNRAQHQRNGLPPELWDLIHNEYFMRR